jgi:hypothetical protein
MARHGVSKRPAKTDPYSVDGVLAIAGFPRNCFLYLPCTGWHMCAMAFFWQALGDMQALFFI